MFRRKWREDKGLCSLFEKRQLYKQALMNSSKVAPLKTLLNTKQKDLQLTSLAAVRSSSSEERGIAKVI